MQNNIGGKMARSKTTTTITVSAEQPTLDAAIFKPLVVENVRINFSGGMEMPLKALEEKFNGQPIAPGSDIEFIVRGYICGAGVKWKEGDKKGTSVGNVNVNLTKLNAVIKPVATVEEAIAGVDKAFEVLDEAKDAFIADLPSSIDTSSMTDTGFPVEWADMKADPIGDEDLEEEQLPEPEPAISGEALPSCFATWEADHPDCAACAQVAPCEEATPNE
jgi:hypothetical protein